MALVSTSTPLFSVNLTTSLVTGTATTSFAVSGGTTAAIASGSTLYTTFSGNTQNWVTSAAISGGATSIPVVSQMANYPYPSGSTTVATYFTSPTNYIARAVYVTGSVISDQSGVIYIDQSGDGTDWDVTASINVVGGIGIGFQETLVASYFRVRYINGSTNQSYFRLFSDARDVYGTFLLAQATPSPGGAYLALYYDPTTQSYEVVNRFDGVDAFNVNEQAAIVNGISGKYASCLVSQFVATQETVSETSTSTSTAF